MARVTVEDCLAHLQNRFALVILASRRARQIMKGSAPMVKASNKPSVLSLREIAAGKVRFDQTPQDVFEEHGSLR